MLGVIMRSSIFVVTILILILGIGCNLWGQQLRSASIFAALDADSTLIKAPVVFKDKVVFYIYTSYGPFSQLERSGIVNARLAELSTQKHLYLDSLHIVSGTGEETIYYSNKPLYAVSLADSVLFQKPVKEIAQAYYDVLKLEFIPMAAHLTMRQGIILIVKTVLFAILVLVVMLFAFKILGKLLKFLNNLIESVKNKHPDGLVIHAVRVVSATQLSKFAKMIVHFIRFVLILLILYFSLYMLLMVIPATRGVARQLQAYVSNPVISVGNGILHYLPNLFFIAVILIVAKYVLNFVKYLFHEVEIGNIRLGNFYAEWASTTYQIVKFLIFFFVTIIIFPYLPGSDSPAFKGVSIFVGVLFSLGSTSAIANIIAGIILTYMRAYRIGSMVKIGDKTGEIIETTLLVVRIRTPKNEEITIPNSLVLSGNITNYSAYASESNLVLHTKVTIGYDVPWQKVSSLLMEAALRSQGIVKERPPFVNITSLMDYYVEYELNAYTDKASSMPATYAELHRNILDTFAEADVEIMSPMYNSVRDGNASTIPKKE